MLWGALEESRGKGFKRARQFWQWQRIAGMLSLTWSSDLFQGVPSSSWVCFHWLDCTYIIAYIMAPTEFGACAVPFLTNTRRLAILHCEKKESCAQACLWMENDKGLRGQLLQIRLYLTLSFEVLETCSFVCGMHLLQSSKIKRGFIRWMAFPCFSQVTRPIMNQRQLWRRGKCPGEQLE